MILVRQDVRKDRRISGGAKVESLAIVEHILCVRYGVRICAKVLSFKISRYM